MVVTDQYLEKRRRARARLATTAWSFLATGAPLLAFACGGESLSLQGEGTQGEGADAGIPGPSEQSGGTAGSGAVGARGGRPAGGTSGRGAAGDGDGQGDAGASAGGAESAPVVSLAGAPIYTRAQRLTLSQWERAVTDILRFPAPASLSRDFVVPIPVDADFTNNERLLFVEQQAALDFQRGAEAAAALATESAEALARIYPGDDVEGFVRELGRRAFRRAITQEEESRYRAIFAVGEEVYGSGFTNGAALVVRAMLQSPHFLYRTELGPGGEPLSGYEVASKLSFWLLGTTPRDELLDAAERGELDSVDGLEAAARALLEEAAAVDVMRDFHSQLHHVARYATLTRPEAPGANSNAEFELASQTFFDEVYRRGEGLREILTSTRAFVGPTLADLYGMEPVPAGLAERTLGASRIGYFMQVPFLLLHGRSLDPNTIGRSLPLARDVLCRTLSPPSEDPLVPVLEPGQTNRERLEGITTPCGTSCHATFQPLGLALENFDGLGRERELDNGKPVDTAATYDFGSGPVRFSDGKELMRILADSPQAHTCYAKKLSSYALQRDIVAGDRELLDALSSVSLQASLKEMVVALVRNTAFRVRAEETP